MDAYFYTTYSPAEVEKALILTTKEEVDAFTLAQSRNQFIEELKRLVLELIGEAADVLTNPRLLGSNRYSSFSISEGVSCGGLDFSSLASLEFPFLGVVNVGFFDNETLPVLKHVKEVLLGRAIGNRIELHKMPGMRVLQILKWKQSLIFDGSCKVDSVTIWGFKPDKKDGFRCLRVFDNAGELILNKPTCADLQGIEVLHRLTSLEIHYGTKLESVDAVRSLGFLRFVILQACKKISDISPFGDCAKLSRLTIVNCGRIAGLGTLRRLKVLKELVILKTKIADEELPLLGELKLEYCKGLGWRSQQSADHCVDPTV